MDFKWEIYICERCNCYFALDKTNKPYIIRCPNCCKDYGITKTGKYLPSGKYYNEDEVELK